MTSTTWVALLCAAVLLAPHDARAQAAATPPAAAQPERNDPDIPVNPLQPDFNLVALPTTLRLPAHKWSFRVTHRFTRALGQGDFGDLLSDAFGFDGGAQVGLEFRYGLISGTQIGVHRTSDRTIQLFVQQNFLNDRERPFGLDAIATFEGENNMRSRRQAAVGLLVSRKIGRYLALYAEPLWVANTNPFNTGEQSTLMAGLGGRLRIRPSLYLVGEITPRLAGYNPDFDQGSFGLEGRAGGHLFQINFSNGFGTTLGQLARGGFSRNDWYLGFNMSRKFF